MTAEEEPTGKRYQKTVKIVSSSFSDLPNSVINNTDPPNSRPEHELTGLNFKAELIASGLHLFTSANVRGTDSVKKVIQQIQLWEGYGKRWKGESFREKHLKRRSFIGVEVRTAEAEPAPPSAPALDDEEEWLHLMAPPSPLAFFHPESDDDPAFFSPRGFDSP